MKYHTTLLEDWIKDLLHNLGIHHPHQLNFDILTQRLGLIVIEKPIKSRIYNGVVFIDSRLTSEQEKWQVFAHELKHYLRHAGNQLLLPKPFVDLQEKQAENFAHHLCVPTFMLLNYEIANYTNLEDGIRFISDTFNVTGEFAKKRLQHFRNQIQQAQSNEKFQSDFLTSKNYYKNIPDRKMPLHAQELANLAIQLRESRGTY
ncbi:ImmA/IrrE family metallo-endopeptidase [Niallia circulans]|uniref:ImmA/IrrE family metallo-endopeptidase n=1 Tax=Niallia circulans TaxID=1397 RepID=UPI003524DB75